MSDELYRYRFQPSVPLKELETTLLLAIMATESLHGQAQVRLDAGHCLDRDRRACVIDAATPVGRDLNRLFVGFALREFGEDAFRVEHVNAAEAAAVS
jgi:hypothetical protein